MREFSMSISILLFAFLLSVLACRGWFVQADGIHSPRRLRSLDLISERKGGRGLFKYARNSNHAWCAILIVFKILFHVGAKLEYRASSN